MPYRYRQSLASGGSQQGESKLGELPTRLQGGFSRVSGFEIQCNKMTGYNYSIVSKDNISAFKDGLPYLFHSFRNKHFNKISLGNLLYFQNKLYKF